MEAISWAFKPVLESVHPQEPQVQAGREAIANTLEAALVPVRQYIARVQAYEGWLAVDPAVYVDALQVSVCCTATYCQLSYCLQWSLQVCSATAPVRKRQKLCGCSYE